MEKDIDVLRESIIEEKYHLYKEDLKKCVKNIINDYQRQLEINQEHQRVNGELQQKIKELENADLTTIYLNGVYDERAKWITKIKNIIKELEERKMDIVTSPVHNSDEKIEILRKNKIEIEILKKLLGRG